jgi:hypothetical protein
LDNKEAKNQRAEPGSLDEQASAYLRKNGARSVGQLYEALMVGNPLLTEEAVTDLVWRLVKAGQVDVEDMPPSTTSLLEYLRLWERNWWFYMAVAIPLMTILVIYAVPSQFPLIVVRWAFGSALVLFIPGYVTLEALLPKGHEFDRIERFALSVGVSLTLIPLIGLLLNYTPWGITLTPILISLALFTLALSFLALERQYQPSSRTRKAEQLVQGIDRR